MRTPQRSVLRRPKPAAGRGRRRVGMRREVELFVPFAALVLVGLTVTILLIHRAGVRGLREELRASALRSVDRVVADLSAGGGAEETLHRHAASGGVGLALLEADGRARWTAGRIPSGDLLAPLDAVQRRSLAGVVVHGPGRDTGGSLVIFAPVTLGDRSLVLRRDQPARRLAALVESLPLLAATVFGASAALLVLLVLYLRHLLRPFDLLLDRARQVEGGALEEGDDVAWILSSFDKALDALRESSSEEGELAVLERALTHLDSGLLLLDAQGRLLALNDSGRRLLGVGEAVEGKSLDQALAHQPELRARLREALLRGEPVHRAEIPISAGPEEGVVGLTLNPLRRDDDRIRGWLGLFADLTEARRVARSRQLGESLHQIGELTAGLAHELRNGLASLRGYLTLVERGQHEESDDLVDYLAEIRREVDDLHRTAEDFLDFARPGNIRSEPLQPERLAHRAAADPALSGAPVRVEISASARTLEALGDPHLVGRALRNLLDNAVRAQREAGVSEPVHLIVEGERELRFRVVDRGPGLAPSVRDRLFVPFASARSGGSGLGLSLAQRIAQLHGGAVEIREPAEGGVEAILVLPAGAIATVGNGSVLPLDPVADGELP